MDTRVGNQAINMAMSVFDLLGRATNRIGVRQIDLDIRSFQVQTNNLIALIAEDLRTNSTDS